MVKRFLVRFLIIFPQIATVMISLKNRVDEAILSRFNNIITFLFLEKLEDRKKVYMYFLPKIFGTTGLYQRRK